MKLIILILAMGIFSGCATAQVDYSPPPTIVYTTRADYRNNVPVILSDDRTQIISYPDPSDLRGDTAHILPTQLADGYLLDNRGINANVAFLRMTYAQYAALPASPKAEELFIKILDKDPIIEMYNCGTRRRFKNIEQELNDIIHDHRLGEFRVLKGK
ncbi:MAG: hypothetical protein ABIR47_05230 [Candidatus Kapaibacterium sp.]